MRLVCPNCDAKYEVPDDAIPQSGRDVQCANCNHAWFQMKPGTEPASARKASVSAEPLTETHATAAEVSIAAPTVAPAEAEDLAEPTPSAGLAGKGYAVDESVLAILREEAEREAKARSIESRPIETQTDLGLDTAIPAAVATAAVAPVVDRVVHSDPGEEGTRPSARRDLLPDVEEINSTLRPSERPVDPDAEIEALPDLTAGRNSFRSGFLIIMGLAIIALVAYLAAPQLAQQVPSLQGPLTAYVNFVDTLRSYLDGLMQTATTAINGST
ncbi:zinc-ribbon domain-containing protein [Tabrizicola sp. BL-A-41-H6]|uniref:zinc-ribbon domain-containing protein n=1 Tax=Tabrizicola sp. BL-A-41-H6 TaxID=3421107 RepID=UPI003D67C423